MRFGLKKINDFNESAKMAAKYSVLSLFRSDNSIEKNHKRLKIRIPARTARAAPPKKKQSRRRKRVRIASKTKSSRRGVLSVRQLDKNQKTSSGKANQFSEYLKKNKPKKKPHESHLIPSSKIKVKEVLKDSNKLLENLWFRKEGIVPPAEKSKFFQSQSRITSQKLASAGSFNDASASQNLLFLNGNSQLALDQISRIKPFTSAESLLIPSCSSKTSKPGFMKLRRTNSKILIPCLFKVFRIKQLRALNTIKLFSLCKKYEKKFMEHSSSLQSLRAPQRPRVVRSTSKELDVSAKLLLNKVFWTLSAQTISKLKIAVLKLRINSIKKEKQTKHSVNPTIALAVVCNSICKQRLAGVMKSLKAFRNSKKKTESERNSFPCHVEKLKVNSNNEATMMPSYELNTDRSHGTQQSVKLRHLFQHSLAPSHTVSNCFLGTQRRSTNGNQRLSLNTNGCQYSTQSHDKSSSNIIEKQVPPTPQEKDEKIVQALNLIRGLTILKRLEMSRQAPLIK